MTLKALKESLPQYVGREVTLEHFQRSTGKLIMRSNLRWLYRTDKQGIYLTSPEVPTSLTFRPWPKASLLTATTAEKFSIDVPEHNYVAVYTVKP